ncbi:MAG: ATP-binding protein [bacterium]|nr:ATP-binding protein [bacterium]
MITLIETLNFRCLRYVSQPVGRFHVLVGPNASGKTTFLDVVAFLGRLVSEGLEAAIGERTQNLQDLVWGRSGDSFELAIELAIPESLRATLGDAHHDTVRYELAVGIDPRTEEVGLRTETVALKITAPRQATQKEVFPELMSPPPSILAGPRAQGSRTVINKVPDGNDNFYSETYTAKGKGWAPAFRLGPRRSALRNLPEDETKFPVATWLKGLLIYGVRQLILNSLLIRKASPPGRIRTLKSDGSNLPWIVEDLKKKAPERFTDWIAHLQTAFPDLEDIRTVERPDDRHRYLMLRYHGGLDVPSWMASDGTLRMLALTLPAYLPDFTGIYLIEEPENGIHPRAVEAMSQSLSSVYGAQILLATHSPVMLSVVDTADLLCFAKADEGATDLVSGSDHPALRDWRHETDLSVLFAAGVLG